MAYISETSWTLTASDIELIGNSVLRALLQRRDGEWQEATFDLNEYIGNDDGRWDVNGVNFGETASDVSLDDRRPDYGLYLCASLQRRDGSWTGFVEIDIANALSNDDGNFVWTGF